MANNAHSGFSYPHSQTFPGSKAGLGMRIELELAGKAWK